MIPHSHRYSPAPPGPVAALVLIVLGAVLLAGCTSQSEPIISVNTPATPGPNLPAYATMPATLAPGVTVTRLEVFHFHPTRGCATCTEIGRYANDTVSTHFADELAAGTLAFQSINLDLDENRAVVEQYRVTGSSLMLGVYTSDGRFYAEENIKVWYRTDDRQRFMDYLRGVIEMRLAGDLSPA